MPGPATMAATKITQTQGFKWGIILFFVIVIILIIYLVGKRIGRLKAGAGRKPLKAPASGWSAMDYVIPPGWSATPSAVALYGAMKGMGTDEEAIWNTLENKTNAQLLAIYNEFNNRYPGDDLFEWFRGDLDGEELARAMGYFKGVI